MSRILAASFAAIFEDGVLKPLEHTGLAEHEVVEVAIKRKPQEDSSPQGQRIFGSAKGIIKRMSEDFDEPLEDFREYM